MTRILFVDDEIHVLDGLRRAMRSMRDEWDMRFVTGGAEALAELALVPADVVVSDMRMPGLTGTQLLEEVKRLYPGTIRFILSGHAEPTAVLQAAATAHQYLPKPCDTLVLRNALARAQTLRALLSNDRIAAWAGGAEALPSLPMSYRRIVACVQAPDASVSDVARVIKEDLSVSAMLLKIANSAFFGVGQTVTRMDRAVSFLGIDNVAALILAHGVFQPPRALPSTLDIARLWRHSLKVAALARSLALHERWSAARADDAFLTGVLHDIGHLVIATAPAAAVSAADEAVHAQVGAYLVGLWGFPGPIVEAIAFHHRPSQATEAGIGLPGLLHAANRLAHAAETGHKAEDEADVDAAYFAAPGMSERWTSWQACAAEPTANGRVKR